MKQLGLGVMLGRLTYGSADDTLAKVQGRVIRDARLDPDGGNGDGELRLTFTDGSALTLSDRGRSCCESRYLHTDDDLDVLQGATLQSIEVRDGPTHDPDEWGEVHEVQFLHLITDRATAVIATHNEHNGYYGGFLLTVDLTEPGPEGTA